MNSGLWALAGVGVGTLLNLLVWFVQFKLQRRREEWITACGKLEELARLLTKTDELIKNAVTESMVAPDLIALWKDKKFWTNLNLIYARVIVSIHFPKALDLFDQMQVPLLEFSNIIKLLMERGGFEDRSGLAEFHDKFASARTLFLQECQKLLHR
jgi:hypothetical protein